MKLLNGNFPFYLIPELHHTFAVNTKLTEPWKPRRKTAPQKCALPCWETWTLANLVSNFSVFTIISISSRARKISHHAQIFFSTPSTFNESIRQEARTTCNCQNILKFSTVYVRPKACAINLVMMVSAFQSSKSGRDIKISCNQFDPKNNRKVFLGFIRSVFVYQHRDQTIFIWQIWVEDKPCKKCHVTFRKGHKITFGDVVGGELKFITYTWLSHPPDPNSAARSRGQSNLSVQRLERKLISEHDDDFWRMLHA